jgi:hypothetical protein
MKSMACSQTRMSPAENDHVTDLVKGSQWLPDVLGVTSGRRGVRVDFPESEFFIHTKDDPASEQCRVMFTAVVRAGPPSLSTWWCDWTRICPNTRAVEMTLEAIIEERSRFRRLLDEASEVELNAGSSDSLARQAHRRASGTRP